jgi:hypothetical protein
MKKSRIQEIIREEFYELSESIDSKLINVMVGEYNGAIKRKKLKKLGISDDEVKSLEDKYRQIYLTVAQKVGAETKDIKDNFGGISVYFNEKFPLVKKELKKELSKIKHVSENINNKSLQEDFTVNDYKEIKDIIRAEVVAIFFDLYKKRAIWT